MSQDLQERPVGISFILFWVVAFALFVLVSHWWFGDGKGSAETVVSMDGSKKLIIEAGRGGHYRVSGEINGVSAHFLIDTGATSLAIPESLAKEANLDKKYRVSVSTANGMTEGYFTRVNELVVGPFKLKNVAAIIMPDRARTVLLGMNVLKKLNFNQSNGKLILNLK